MAKKEKTYHSTLNYSTYFLGTIPFYHLYPTWVIFRLVVMSLRAQSLLNLKMYKLKKHELKVMQQCCLTHLVNYSICVLLWKQLQGCRRTLKRNFYKKFVLFFSVFRIRDILVKIRIFGSVPTFDHWIELQILLFLSVAFKTSTKNYYFSLLVFMHIPFWRYIYIILQIKKL